MSKPTPIKHVVTVSESLAGSRLDFALAKLLPEYSRAKLQHWIQADHVTVDGKVGKNPEKVAAGAVISLEAELEVVEPCVPEAIHLTIVYEDDDLLVINKPVGLVVHPGAGNPGGTLVNALLNYCPALNQLPRAGLVHRLDKDTSGLLVIAKTISTHTRLVRMIQSRKVSREYVAIVEGTLIAGGDDQSAVGSSSKTSYANGGDFLG